MWSARPVLIYLLCIAVVTANGAQNAYQKHQTPSWNPKDVLTPKCGDFGLCSQFCKMVGNSPNCLCTKGYRGNYKGAQRCWPVDPTWTLVYSTHASAVGLISRLENHPFIRVRSSSVYGGDNRELRASHAVSVDARSNVVYWTDVGSSRAGVYRKFLDGNSTNAEMVADMGIHSPAGVAFDWITGNLYIAVEDVKHIKVCSNKTANVCSILIKDIDVPGDIALNPNARLMYFCVTGRKNKIMRSGMDGSDPTIIADDLGLLTGITLDLPNQRLYLVDATSNKIYSMRLDGTDIRVIFEVFKWNQENLLRGIDILGDRLFWGNELGIIKSRDKFTGNFEEELLDNRTISVFGIALMHVAKQPIEQSNPCQYQNCSHVCTLSPVSSPVSFRCSCPEHLVLGWDNMRCEAPTELIVASGNNLTTIVVNSATKDVTAVTLATDSFISAMVYDPIKDRLIISDVGTRKIFANNSSTTGFLLNATYAVAMDIDPISENLYWIDETTRTLQVMSLKSRATVTLDYEADNVSDLLFVSQTGLLYISHTESAEGFLVELYPNGQLKNKTSLGGSKLVSMVYDPVTNNIAG